MATTVEAIIDKKVVVYVLVAVIVVDEAAVVAAVGIPGTTGRRRIIKIMTISHRTKK